MSKATILVRLKAEVLDPQGDAVKRALDKLGFQGVRGVRIGKLIEIDFGDAPAADRERLAKMADEMLANPVIEDFEIQADAPKPAESKPKPAEPAPKSEAAKPEAAKPEAAKPEAAKPAPKPGESAPKPVEPAPSKPKA